MTLTQISSRGVEDTLRWSLGASGTDHYTFTGPGLTGTVNDPTIYLSRGQTYIFENNSGGHPFQIQSTAGSGGSAYNTGVTNNGGGNGTEIKITVAHDSPDILYYQCTSHANMGGQFNIAGSVAAGSITTAKIADDAVDADKLANSINTAIAANTAKDLTALSASNLTSGTVPDARFPATLPAVSGANLTNLPAAGISDVVSDTSPQLGGALDMNNQNITSNDSSGGGNNRIVLGSGSDFQLWHDGSNSFIADEGTGSLVIQTDALAVKNAAGTENILYAQENGAVELFYDNAKKLETMTNGVRVQGGILFGSDTADANVLDDYEEGTIDNINVLNGWGYLGSGSDANAAPTMTYNGGKYVKIGDMVYVHMRIKIGSYNSAQGTMVFGIMPFYADRGGTENLLDSHLGCWMNSCSSGGENVYVHTYGSSKYYYGIGKRHSSGVSDFTGPNGGSSFDCAINGWYRIE